MNVKRYDAHTNIDDFKSDCHESKDGLMIKYEDYAELEARFLALAAEIQALKDAHPQPFGPEMMKALDAYEKHQDDVPETGMLDAFFILRDSIRVNTPATNAFLAEVRAQAHKEGAHFVANRMLAAWEAGFIDDTAKNAADIARMILTSTEFMAEAPSGDFDRSFADGVLDDIARQLRESKGANHE